MSQKRVAVFFGGLSPEHDVSILTGIKAIEAIDRTLFDPFGVYIDLNGDWWVGDKLTDRRSYHLTKEIKKSLTQVKLPVGSLTNSDTPYLESVSDGGLFGKTKKIDFNIALNAFHGGQGETGGFQGTLEHCGIPFTGCGALTSEIFMNKRLAKKLFREAGIPVLDDQIITRTAGQKGPLDVAALTKDIKISYPVCAKPNNLGSSVGVYKCDNEEELHGAVLGILALDDTVLIEPYVENLIEYNVSLTTAFDKPTISAIETPLSDEEASVGLLSFADKYLAEGGIESKLTGPVDAGMESATREIEPKHLSKKRRKIIEESALRVAELLPVKGAPRIDFLCNDKSDEVYLNEVNTIPGSLAFYLWEAATPKIGFTKLLTALIEEAEAKVTNNSKGLNLRAAGSAIFPDRP